MLGRVQFQEGGKEKNLKTIQITLRIPLPVSGPEPKPGGVEAKEPELEPEPEPVPAQPTGPKDSEEPEIDPTQPVELARDDPEAPPTLEPGFPGTGDVARNEPEGSPGPPPILGVGSSPPPGDGNGLGGDGVGRGTGSRTRGRAGRIPWGKGPRGAEDAVLRGLRWLARHQDDDGGWSAANFSLHCHHFTQCLGKGLEDFNVGLTGLCSLAFLGFGQLPGPEGPYGRNLERALDYLLANQRFDGALGARGDKYLYNHAIATFALCEAYSFTRDSRYLKALMSALNFSTNSQQSGGGWDYSDTKTGRNDLSITGWQVMAIRTALNADIPISGEMVRRLRSYLHVVSLPNGEAVYASSGIGQGRRGINMTAVALLSRLYLGTSLKNSWVRVAADRLMKNPPEPEKVVDWDTYFQSSYYWYYASLALFHLGGDRWEAWNHILLRALLPLQSREPHEEGSWAPDGNWLGASGGRVFTTAMNILTLEVYYRYPPLHAYRKQSP